MTKRARSGSLGRAAPPSVTVADTIQVAGQKFVVDYLEDVTSNSKFHTTLDDFMKRFTKSFEATARELKLDAGDIEIRAGIAVPVQPAKDNPRAAVASKGNAPNMGGVVSVLPLSSVSKTTTTTQSGSSFDVVTVKNDKIQAGFLLPKKDKPVTKVDGKTCSAPKERAMEAGFLLPKKGMIFIICDFSNFGSDRCSCEGERGRSGCR